MDIKKARELNTSEGFIARYYKNLSLAASPRDAYLATEEEHHDIFGKNRYSSWDSFRVIKNRNL